MVSVLKRFSGVTEDANLIQRCPVSTFELIVLDVFLDLAAQPLVKCVERSFK